MLDAPVPKLTTGNEIDILKHFSDARTLEAINHWTFHCDEPTNLVAFQAVLEDVLHD